MGLVGDSIQISYCEGISDTPRKKKFHKYLGIIPNRRNEFVVRSILEIQERSLKALALGSDPPHVPKGPTVDIIDTNDMCITAE